MTSHAPAACHDCGKETCVASLSGGLLDRLDCARAKSARLEAESTRLRAILTGSLALANVAAGGVPTDDPDLLPRRIEDAVGRLTRERGAALAKLAAGPWQPAHPETERERALGALADALGEALTVEHRRAVHETDCEACAPLAAWRKARP